MDPYPTHHIDLYTDYTYSYSPTVPSADIIGAIPSEQLCGYETGGVEFDLENPWIPPAGVVCAPCTVPVVVVAG